MLKRLWLRLGAFLGKSLLLLVGLGLLGWAIATGWYAWRHSGPVSTVEQVPSDEAARTQDIIQTAVRIVDQHREGTRYLRDALPKYRSSMAWAAICARACSPNRARPGRR